MRLVTRYSFKKREVLSERSLIMRLFKKKKEKQLKAFASGTIVPLKDVQDEMFSAGLMGPGIAIQSYDGKFYSPTDGVITMLFPTLHALGIRTEDGEELLLHIGIDTVNLKGEGFQSYVKNGQKIMTGDLLLEADMNLLKEKGYPTEAILCISEPKDIQVTFTLLKEVSAKKDVLVSIQK